MMVTVFNHGKKRSVSAWSWPSREIAHKKAIECIANRYSGKFEPAAGSLRYLYPTHYADLLDCIFESDCLVIKYRFQSVFALS